MDKKTFVSVIVPVYNAKDYLLSSLSAIKESLYKDFEIIVVDDNSNDGSGELAKKYADRFVAMEKREAPGKARNKGASISSGSILFFVDADVRITPNTISEVVKEMELNKDIKAIFGSYDDKPFFNNFFSQYKNLFHHFVHQNANPDASTFWAGCGAMRKDTFVKMGGFPESYSSSAIEDVELGYKLAENGNKVKLLKNLQVKHLKKWNFANLLRTDITQRALPWTKLAFSKGLPKDLNFRLGDRISGISSFFLLFSFILMWKWNWIFILFAGFITILFYLNRSLYKFFLKKKGLKFTVLAIGFHWFYLFYSFVTFTFSTLFLYFKKFILKEEIR